MARAWWSLRTHQAAADTAYKFADDKPAYLQTEPPRSCTARVADAATATRAAVSAAARKLLCFRSLWWSMPLAFASVALSIAWFVMILIVDADTVDAQYAFTPLPARAYFSWGIAMYVIVPMLWVPVLATLCMEANRAACWVVYFVSTVFVVLLVVGNALSATRTSDRRAIEQDFAAQFNALYCNARSVHTCLDNAQTDVLVLAGIGNATALNAAPNATAGALTVFAHCSATILESMDRDAQSIVKDPVAYVPTVYIHQLLNDADAVHDTDAWCGRRAAQMQAGVPLSDAEQRAPAAPFASNTDMFERYVREWPRRMLFANVLLGSAVGCMVLAAVSWTLYDKSGGY